MSYNERPAEYGFVLDCLRHVGKGPNLDIADIGCGRGRQAVFGRMLGHCGATVTQTDNKPAGRHVVVDDITESLLPAAAFDAVLCISVLEHIPQYEAALGHLGRICRPGGIVVVTCPAGPGPTIDDVYKIPESNLSKRRMSFVCRQVSVAEAVEWRPGGARLLEVRYWRCWTGRYWRSGRRVGFCPTPQRDPTYADLIGLCWRKDAT
jgi:SAM-dependent methyltransferase